MEKIPVTLDFKGNKLNGYLNPVDDNDPPLVYHVVLDNSFIGTLSFINDEWVLDGSDDQGLGSILGDYLTNWFQ